MSLRRLLFRNLFKHPIRTLLTVGATLVAIFLLIMLRSVVTTMNEAVNAARTNRLVTQSAVSLFVDLPENYKSKIAAVDGVESVSNWNWFGGIYKDPSNFFAQFAVDAKTFLEQYPECTITEEEKKAFLADRRGCIVGAQLKRSFGADFEVGKTLPLIGTIYPKADGTAWEYNIRGTYTSARATMDENTMFFHYEYLDEMRKAGLAEGPKNVGIFITKAKPGFALADVSAGIDALFHGGPQRTRTLTEAAFNQGFVSMLGDLPTFFLMIGLAVVFAVTLTVVNTMLISARERVRDIGVLKALGFTDRTAMGLYLSESILLATLGGGTAIALSVVLAPGLRDAMAKNAANFGMFTVHRETLLAASGLTLVIGLLGGIMPAILAARLKAVDALRAEI